MRAYCLIRDSPHYRRDAFLNGLGKAGYKVTMDWPEKKVKPGDVLVIWNRYGHFEDMAKNFEREGGTVLVAENGYMGVEWIGSRWYALSKTHHNGAGSWPEGSHSRWDSLGVELKPWRDGGREIVILAQRSIGPKGVAMPLGWADETRFELQKRTNRPVRVREHPGMNAATPLDQDLKNAFACVTWGSGAGLKALAMGIPVFSPFKKWIGAGASMPLDLDLENPFRGDRLPMFRRLAWAMWDVNELASGEPFRQCASL